jgi:hypothetical protein
MQSPELKEFLMKNRDLFWFTPEDKITEISDSFIVETILNYGDKNAVVELIELLGMKKVASIFYESINKSERTKGNYSDLTIHFFKEVFNKYAH